MLSKQRRKMLLVGVFILVMYWVFLYSSFRYFRSWTSTAERGRTCAEIFSRRGPNQKVVSFSFYGSLFNDQDEQNPNWFAQGMGANAEALPEKFGPDWVMRIYHDVPSENAHSRFYLSKLEAEFDHLDMCYVGDLDPTYFDLQPTVWRFHPLADPLVSVFHSRDLDSRTTSREMAALSEFHSSEEAMFHVMRDHRQHRAFALAGLWGAKPLMNRELANVIYKGIFSNAVRMPGEKFLDQNLLAEYLHPAISSHPGLLMAHDSYHCGVFSPVSSNRPFPVQRKEEPYNFVGSQAFGNWESVMEPCPPPCRPENHKDWTFC